MVKSMALIMAGILATIFLATTGALMAGAIDPLIAVPVLTGAVAGGAWLYKRDRRRDGEIERTSSADSEKRYRELSMRASAPGFELIITGSANATPALTIVLLGGVAFVWAIAHTMVAGFIAAAVLLSFATFFLLASIPSIGKPKLTLAKSGFATPLTPFISWEDVDGVFFQKVAGRRSGVTYYGIVFRVTTLPRNISRFGLFHRLIFRLRTAAKKDHLFVMLKDTSEYPEVIYRLARLLWTERTGRGHDWNPNMSDDYNAALRQVSEAARRAKDPQAFGELLSRDPREAKAVVDAMEQGTAVMRNEARRELRPLNWLVWIGIAAIAVVLAGHFLS